MAPLTNMVKVQRNVHGKSNETNNFAFEDMVILGLESTRLDGQVAKIGLNGPMTNRIKV